MKSSVSTEKHDFILNYKFGGISHFHHPGKHNEQVVGADVTISCALILSHPCRVIKVDEEV